jgi:hypothetical protein
VKAASGTDDDVKPDLPKEENSDDNSGTDLFITY